MAYRALLGPLEPIRSAFTLRYSTLLSLFDQRRGRAGNPEERLAQLVRSSLRQFQLYGEARAAEFRLAELDIQLAVIDWPEQLAGRQEQLTEYIELQRQLTDIERARTPRNPGNAAGRGRAKRRRARQRPKSSLRELIRIHSFHEIATDPTFQIEQRQRMKLLRERSRMVSVIEQANTERDYDADRTARGVSSVLRRLGYIERDALLPKSAGLREMVAPGGIVLSEMYWMGAFDHVAAGQLAEILSWFAHDQDRSRYNSFRLPPELQSIYSMAVMTFRRVSGLEEGQGIRLAQGPSSWFWGVALAWRGGQSVHDIMPRIEIGEGDIVSSLNKTIDLLDQFRGLAFRNCNDRLTQTADDARRLLSRGLVAMMRSEGPAALISSAANGRPESSPVGGV